MGAEVLLRDVTLREHGQNVRTEGLSRFCPEARLWLARELVTCGLRAMEVASTASPKVAPAMDPDILMGFLHELGRVPGVELITLVPSAGSAARFFDLGLGPDDLGHTMGVFVSAVEEHNLANTRRTIAETMAELHAFLPAALLVGVRVAGYVSGAFGFAPRGRKTPIPAPVEIVVELASALVDLGASSVTLSDLQGLAGPSETSRVVGEVVAALGSSGPPVGYHPHHGQTEAALDNVEAAVRAGATIVDGSLGATGGCITGAPGNVPTEHVAERLVAMGATRGLDVDRIRRLAAEARVRVFAGT